MSRPKCTLASAWSATFLLLLITLGSYPNRPLAAGVQAVVPAHELEIAWGPADTPRQLLRKPGLPPQVAPPGGAKGILQQASQKAGAARVDRNAHAATVRAFLTGYRTYLRLDDPVAELQLERQFTDDLQRTHFRYRQQYRGLPVWPTALNVHLDRQGNVELMNGNYIPTPHALAIQPAVDGDTALAVARSAVPHGDLARTSLQELIIYAPASGAARLAWKFGLDTSLDKRWVVVIDALDRSALALYNDVRTFRSVAISDTSAFGPIDITAGFEGLGAVSGSGVDLFGQTRPLNVFEEVDGRFYMVDTSKPMFKPGPFDGYIAIYDLNHQTSGTLYPISSSQRNSGWLRDGVSGAYHISKTYDYYWSRCGRNSINGRGGSIRAVVRVGVNWDNAVWSDDALYFGDAKPYVGVLDVVEHEVAHGVTSYSAALIYQDQSGALSESFGDIFGQNVEVYVTGSTDWLVGAALGAPVRSLKDPSSLEFLPGHPYPSRMSQYVSGSILDNFANRDNGGVHINSSIVNYAYYLLAVGLSGGIGVADSERIFYRALTVHLSPNAQFLDARLACIQSAGELFGANSRQAKQVAAAFDAVEISTDTGVGFQRSSWKRALTAEPSE